MIEGDVSFDNILLTKFAFLKSPLKKVDPAIFIIVFLDLFHQCNILMNQFDIKILITEQMIFYSFTPLLNFKYGSKS